MTTDVQKNKEYYVIRAWFDGGDSALIECGELSAWKDHAAAAAKHQASKIFPDLGYSERRNEVLEQCVFGEIKGAVPMFGRDSLKEAYKVDRRDPFEGTAKQGRKKIPMVTFNPDQIKHILSLLTSGDDPHQWMIPNDIDTEYIRQMTSEECIDGAWVARRRDNHLWDCEVMQLVAAMVLGVFRQVGIDLDSPEQVTPEQSGGMAAVKTRQRGIYNAD